MSTTVVLIASPVQEFWVIEEILELGSLSLGSPKEPT